MGHLEIPSGDVPCGGLFIFINKNNAPYGEKGHDGGVISKNFKASLAAWK